MSVTLGMCPDCASILANGDSTGIPDDQHETVTTALADTETRWHRDGYHIAYDGEDMGFSWNKCDGCHRPLGGDRIKFVALKR